MQISALSVRRGVTFAMVYLIVVGFGLFSLARLQLDLYPEISFPMVAVITNYTGASPEDIETLITRPIEGAVAAVKDVEEIDSTSKQGTSLVQVHFDWGKDMEQAETDVRRNLELVKGFLPDDAESPLVFAFDPSMQPITIMMVSGPYPLDELRRIADKEISPRLARLPGVASADAEGGLEREIHIVLEPAKVAAFGLDVSAVLRTVYAENTQLPSGSVDQGSLSFTIKTFSKYQSVAEIGEVVVGVRQTIGGPVPLRLKEVAKIKDSFYESERVLEVDGVPAVWLMVRKQSGANTVKAADAVMKALPRIKRAVAAEIDFKVIFNQADVVNRSLGNLSTTAMAGVIITFLVLLFFLRNVRSALIVATAVPLSVVATFGVMAEAGMTLNVLSLAGLALAVGMLVDNSIVVLENIFRLREEGVGPWEAAIKGARSVSTAVVASTLTTISVFVPVLFVPGIAGVMFRDMAVTICFSLAVSLIVALTFIPLAASRLLGTERAGRLLERARDKDVFARVRSAYGRTLDRALGRRRVVIWSVLGLLGLAAGLAAALPTEFVAKQDQSILFVSAETDVRNNLNEAYGIMKEVVAKIEEVVKPEERTLVAFDVGVGKGFVSIFAKGVHAGIFRVPLVPPGERERSQKEIEDAVREALKGIPGVKASLQLPFNPMGGSGDMEIQIRGHDLEISRRVGLELRKRLLAMPEMAEVVFSMDEQKPEVRVHFNRAKLAALGLSAVAATTAISTSFMGRMAGRYAEGGDEFDIVVRYAKDFRMDMHELKTMPLALPTGQSMPLGNVASIEVGLGPVDITRLDQARVTRLTATLKDTYLAQPPGEPREGILGLVDRVKKVLYEHVPSFRQARKDLGGSIEKVEGILAKYEWPKDFTYHVGGSAEDFLTSFKYLGLALAVSMLLVYMVMASQFESLRQPFIIIFTVPLAGVGFVLLFTLTRSNVDISAIIGLIMLVGIVVNNGIVMVDAANQLRLEGLDRIEAIAKASRMRMRPVLMTSLTTILAMTPLALGLGEGSEAWSGLARAVIGGLLAASALTLFVVPTAYTFFARRKYKLAETQAIVHGGET